MDIPNLQECLMQVLREYEQQINLLNNSKNVATCDVLQLLDKNVRSFAIVGNVELDLKCRKCK